MASGSTDYTQQRYFGYFNTSSEPCITSLDATAAGALPTTTYGGLWLFGTPVPFPNLNPDLHVYSLADRVTVLDLDLAKGTFQESALVNPAAVNADNVREIVTMIGQLHNLFKQASADYKHAIATNSADLEHYYRSYIHALYSLQGVLKTYEPCPLVQGDAYNHALYTLANDCKEDALFPIPALRQPTHASPTANAEQALKDYRNRVTFFKENGRFAPESVKRLYLSEAVYALNERLELLEASEKHTFFATHLNDPYELADYQYQRVAYLQKMPEAQFQRERLKYLFDRSQRYPSDALRRQAFLDPEQRAALQNAIALKEYALSQPDPVNYLKQATQGLSNGFWGVVNAASALRYGSERTADDIIMEALQTNEQGWFTSRPLGNFLDDKEADLIVLTELRGVDPREQAARQKATIELARRVQEHACAVWRRADSQGFSIESRQYHAQRATTRENALWELRCILDTLEDKSDGIFGRLDVLARLNVLNPSDLAKHFFFTDAGKLHNNYQEVQDLLMDLTKSISKAIELTERDIRASGLPLAQQDALLYDDYSFLLRFIPNYTMEQTRLGVIHTTQHEHPGFKTRFSQGLQDLKTELEEKRSAVAARIQATNTPAPAPAAAAAPLTPARALAAVNAAAAAAAAAAPAAAALSLSSDYLLTVFDQLIARANRLGLTNPAPADFDTDKFAKDKQALVKLLAGQKIVATEIFKTFFQPDTAKRNAAYANFYNDLNAIEQYIVTLETSLANSAALQAALDNARAALPRFRAATAAQQQAVDAAKQALNLTSPINDRVPDAQRFMLSSHLSAYSSGQ